MTKLPYGLLQIVVPIVLLLGTVLAAIPYAASRQENYEASARVWIQAQIPNNTADQQGEGIYMPFMTFFNSPLLTASEIIKSSEVVNQAEQLLQQRFPNRKLPSDVEIGLGLSSIP